MITLVNKSFLQPTLGGRYEIHELLRQYGQEKLGEDRAQATAVRDRHGAFYCAWLHQCQAGLSSRQQQAVLDEIEADLENVRVAWAWAVEHGRLEVVDQALESLYEFYSIRSRFQEGKELFTRAVTQLQQADVPVKHPKFEVVLTKVAARLGAFRVKLGDYEAANTHLLGSLATAAEQSELAFAFTSLGWVAAYWQGDRSLAEERLHKSLTISREIDDQKSIADTLNKLSSIASTFGQYAAGRQLAKESLVVSRQLGRPDWIAHALHALAWATTCLGEYDEAEAYGRESLTICEEIGDRAAIAKSLDILGYVAWCKGGASLAKAAVYIEKALVIFREISWKWGISESLADLALVYCELGKPAKAQQYSYEAVAIAREVGSPDRLSYELLCLGAATAGLGDFQASRNYLVEAVQIAWEARIPDHTLLALFYFATLLAKESDVAGVGEPVKSQQKARALELLALIIHHPACWQVYRDGAARVQAELEAELPPDVGAAAQERGRARDLWETAEELLVELGGWENADL